MRDARTILNELLRQLNIADEYASGENSGSVPSVWQIQNGLLRDLAREALSSVTSQIT